MPFGVPVFHISMAGRKNLPIFFRYQGCGNVGKWMYLQAGFHIDKCLVTRSPNCLIIAR